MKIIIDLPDKVYSYITTELKDVTADVANSGYDTPIVHMTAGVVNGTVIPQPSDEDVSTEDAIKDLEVLKNAIGGRSLELALKALKIQYALDVAIDDTYWLYYDDDGNLRGEDDE